MFGILPINYPKRAQNIQKTHSSSLSHSHNSTISSPEQLSLKQKVNKIALLNLKDHDLNICACQECIYTRQLNRKHRISLQLSKNSSYRYQYNPNNRGKLINQGGMKIDYENIGRHKVNKSLLVQNSNYDKDYFKEKGYEKPYKMKPQDQLRFVGPTTSFSSYQQQYPSFKNNANPYIKPIEVSVQNTLKMNTKSSYKSQFNGIITPLTQTGKNPDQLHCGKPWTGKSSYKQQFGEPSRLQTIVQDNSRVQYQTIDPNYKHQYQTSYRNQYIAENRKKCFKNGQNNFNPLLLSLQQSLEP